MSIFIYNSFGCKKDFSDQLLYHSLFTLEVYNEKIYSQSKIDRLFFSVVFGNKKNLKNKPKKTIINYRRRKNIIESLYRR